MVWSERASLRGPNLNKDPGSGHRGHARVIHGKNMPGKEGSKKSLQGEPAVMVKEWSGGCWGKRKGSLGESVRRWAPGVTKSWEEG